MTAYFSIHLHCCWWLWVGAVKVKITVFNQPPRHMVNAECLCQSCYYRHVLVVPTGFENRLLDDHKTDQLDNFVLALFHLCTLYIQERPYLETRSDCVFMFEYLLCYCSSLFLYDYTGLRETWSDCVHVRYVLCYCSKSISVLKELRETWSVCVFMFVVFAVLLQ